MDGSEHADARSRLCDDGQQPPGWPSRKATHPGLIAAFGIDRGLANLEIEELDVFVRAARHKALAIGSDVE